MSNSKVLDAGSLKGKVLLFGGVYSNLQALEGLHQIAKRLDIPVSNTICTGDIMGYCAQPNECIELIRNWGIRSIVGNVEVNIRDNVEDCGCNFDEGTRCDILSSNWYPFTQRTISSENKEWLHTLPDFIRFGYAGKDAFVLHGGLTDNSQFVFDSTDWSIKEEILNEVSTDIIIGGHCGLPFHTVVEGKYWLNPGVIGMPANDGTSHVWYMVLDTDNEELNFQHLNYNYDHETAANLMIAKGLPPTYAETLSTGLWDNMEILNEEEKAVRGKKLRF